MATLDAGNLEIVSENPDVGEGREELDVDPVGERDLWDHRRPVEPTDRLMSEFSKELSAYGRAAGQCWRLSPRASLR